MESADEVPAFAILCTFLQLILEAVTDFDVNLSRIVPVKAAEGKAIVEFNPPVRHIQGVHGSRETLAEVFPQRQIERGVGRQVAAGVGLAGKAIGKARPVVNVGGGKAAPGKGDITANVECVALIMVQGTELG